MSPSHIKRSEAKRKELSFKYKPRNEKCVNMKLEKDYYEIEEWRNTEKKRNKILLGFFFWRKFGVLTLINYPDNAAYILLHIVLTANFTLHKRTQKSIMFYVGKLLL